MIFSSEKLSRADVGSSRSTISGSFINIFAIASLCLCPHDNLIHFSQISVSIPFSNSNTKSHSASFKAFIIISSLFHFSIFSHSHISSLQHPFILACKFSLILQSKTDGS